MTKKVYLGMIADIMHPGLINIINEGAKYGDVIIGLFTDKAIATHKRLPYLTYEQREIVVRSIHGVADVVPQDDWSYVPNLVKYNQTISSTVTTGFKGLINISEMRYSR